MQNFKYSWPFCFRHITQNDDDEHVFLVSCFVPSFAVFKTRRKKEKRWEQFVHHQLSFVNFSGCLFWSTHSAGWVCFDKISIDSNRKMFCASYSEHDNDIREMVHVERICKRIEILFSTRIRIRKLLAKKREHARYTSTRSHSYCRKLYVKIKQKTMVRIYMKCVELLSCWW